MRFRMTVASVAVALAVAVPAVNAQMSQDKPQDRTTDVKRAPGQPDPNDRGGEFTITGCLSRQPGASNQPAMFMITRVSPGQANVGEGKAVGAMGGGAPVTGVTHSSAADKQDTPDIVRGEYRIRATERIDLSKFADQQVEARGRLAEAGSSGAASMKMDSSSPKTGMNADIFEATSVKKLSGTCATK